MLYFRIKDKERSCYIWQPLFRLEEQKKRKFMVGLDIQTDYLDIECLADRWKCKIGIIEVLAETGKIKCCIRPAALKNAIESSRPISENTPLSYVLSKDEIYKLFSNRQIPHTIYIDRKNNQEKSEINVAFSDIIVYIENVIEFEDQIHKERDDDFQILSSDFTYILWHGKEMKFGVSQGKIIEQLWKAREAGEPWVYGKRLLTSIGSGAERVRSLFHKNKNWKELILTDYKGKYRLNLPPKRSLNGGIGFLQ